MDHAACIVPAAPVRKKASHKVEMVNQLLFGEIMRVIKEKNNWIRIQSLHDNYEGWIRNNLITPIEDIPSNNSLVAGETINTININETKMLIPVASTLSGLNGGKGKIGSFTYGFKGYSFNRNEVKPDEALVKQLTSQWLNAPYLWGGRTPLGADCSGFVQVIYKMMGIDLLRDAREQIGQGIKVKKIEDARAGDLAFFDKKDKIMHVGILLSPSEIIHSSGRVKIDAIGKKGITNSDTGKRTHSLAEIRRYW